MEELEGDVGVLEISKRNAEALKDVHRKAGYRDGFTAGQEAVVQDGFNKGFSIAVEEYFKLGVLRGVVSALAAIQCNKSDGYDQDLFVDCQDTCTKIADVQRLDPIIRLPKQGSPYTPPCGCHKTGVLQTSVMEGMEDFASRFEQTMAVGAEEEVSRSPPSQVRPDATLSEHENNYSQVDKDEAFSNSSGCTCIQSIVPCSVESDGAVEIPCDLHSLRELCQTLIKRTGLSVDKIDLDL